MEKQIREVPAGELAREIRERGGTVIDIRKDAAFAAGTWPGAVHIEYASAEEDWDNDENSEGSEAFVKAVQEGIGKETVAQPVYVLCHTGDTSREAAGLLAAAGISAFSVKGGYRACLAQILAETPKERTRQQQIERSIIKKFRKQLWSRFTRAVSDYQLIGEGDKVAVCISGGKDSMLMAKLVQELQRHGNVHFEAVYLCMNPGYNEYNWKIIRNNADILGIPLTVFESNIFDAVASIDKNPCYLCARMRRGYLYNNAKQLGCNKIALGHHYDDVIETILMGILFAGKTETMMPKLHSQNFEGMQLIRPMYLIREEDVKAWRDYNGLSFIQCACRFTDTCSVAGGETSSKRAYVKQLIRQLAADDPVIESNIFNCVRDINLRTVLGYHKDGSSYNFLDDYEKYGNSRSLEE